MLGNVATAVVVIWWCGVQRFDREAWYIGVVERKVERLQDAVHWC